MTQLDAQGRVIVPFGAVQGTALRAALILAALSGVAVFFNTRGDLYRAAGSMACNFPLVLLPAWWMAHIVRSRRGLKQGETVAVVGGCLLPVAVFLALWLAFTLLALIF